MAQWRSIALGSSVFAGYIAYIYLTAPWQFNPTRVLKIGAVALALAYVAWWYIARQSHARVRVTKTSISVQRARRRVKISFRAIRAARRLTLGIGDSFRLSYGHEGHFIDAPLWCLPRSSRQQIVDAVVAGAGLTRTTPGFLWWTLGIAVWKRRPADKASAAEASTDTPQP